MAGRAKSRSFLLGRLLFALGLLAAVGSFVASRLALPGLAILLKPVPVWLMALWVLLHPARRDGYGRAIAAGLLCGSVGDLCLAAGPQRLFVQGLGAFLLGHVCYLYALCSDERRLRLGRALPIAAGAAVMLALIWRGLAPGLQLPVVIYSLALGGVAWRAVARIAAPWAVRPDQWAGGLGAILFMISDSVLALNRFHAPVPYAAFVIMSTYWLGQLGLARSAARR